MSALTEATPTRQHLTGVVVVLPEIGLVLPEQRNVDRKKLPKKPKQQVDYIINRWRVTQLRSNQPSVLCFRASSFDYQVCTAIVLSSHHRSVYGTHSKVVGFLVKTASSLPNGPCHDRLVRILVFIPIHTGRIAESSKA